MEPPLRIGLIGFGKIGRVHYRHLCSLPEAQVAVVADPAGVGEAENVPVVADWREVVERRDLDAVVISLPHALHHESAQAALHHGKHVFLEKPLATTLADARHLVECADAAGKVLMVNMTHRFCPPLRRAYEAIRQGAIGEVISVRDYYMEIIDRREFPGWFFDPVMAGGGVVMTDSIHLIDRVAWLLGEPLHFVGGAGRRLEPETAVEDCGEILCGSASGIPVTIGSFFFSGPKSWEDGLTLFGTKGVMKVRAWSHVEWSAYGGAVQREDGYPASLPEGERPLVGHRAAIGEFVSALREGRTPQADGRTALNAQEIVGEFYRFTAGHFS